MLVSLTPKRASRKRSTDVWSKACELTQPPRLQGETTYIGTRGPGPYTRLSAASCSDGLMWRSRSVLMVDAPAIEPSGLSDGAAGDGTWSKKPSFSSKLMSSTVLLQTSGLAVSALSVSWMYQAPCTGLDGPGCSE